MRRIGLLVALAITVAGCVQLGPSGAAAAGSGGAGADATATGAGAAPASGCDGTGDCKACLGCAAAATCAAVISTCQNNPACVGIDDCLSVCGPDNECQQQCAFDGAVGLDDYNAAASCLYCNVCPSDCASVKPCL